MSFAARFTTYMSVFSCKYVWRIRTIDVVEVQEYLQNKNKAPLDEVNSEITGLARDLSFDVNGILKLYFLINVPDPLSHFRNGSHAYSYLLSNG